MPSRTSGAPLRAAPPDSVAATIYRGDCHEVANSSVAIKYVNDRELRGIYQLMDPATGNAQQLCRQGKSNPHVTISL